MTYYRQWSHTCYDCRYHIVRITKYRKKRINSELKEVLSEKLHEICEELFVKMIRVGMEDDHVHLYVSIPLTTWYIPDVIQKLKWRTSKELWEMGEYKNHFKEFYRKEWVWKRAVWYFICTVWEVNDKLIKEYVESQWSTEGGNHIVVQKSPAL